MYDFVVKGNMVGRSFVGGDGDVFRKCKGGESFGGLSLREISLSGVISLLREDISLKNEGGVDDNDFLDDDVSNDELTIVDDGIVVVLLLSMSHSFTYFFSL